MRQRRFATRTARFALVLPFLAAVAACGGDTSDDRTLVERLTVGSFESPEEFSVLPQKPLELPEDLTALPPPTPGAPSRVDFRPQEEALVALSGRPVKAPANASDAALLRLTGGGAAGIRQQLAAEDEVYRDNNKGLLLDRLFGKVRDADIYSGQVLEAETELLRLRRLGIRTPQLPPVAR